MSDGQTPSELESFLARFHAEIKQHQKRFLIECAMVFLAFGAMLAGLWLLIQWTNTKTLFDLHSGLRSKQEHTAFSTAPFSLAPGWMPSPENSTESLDYSPYRRIWHHSDGFRLELRSSDWKKTRLSDSSKLKKRPETLAALRIRAKHLSDSLQRALESSPLPSKPDSSGDSIVRITNIDAIILATERHHPNGTSTILMESGKFVVELSSPHRMGYRDVLSLLDRDRFLFERMGIGTLRGWMRHHHLPIILIFVLVLGFLWMWQILSSPRRFAGIAPHLPTSTPESVQTGLRTLTNLSPAIIVEQRPNQIWSIQFTGHTEAVPLIAPEITSAWLEWRIRLDSASTKARVREIERLRSRQKGPLSWFAQSEISFQVPMLTIPAPPLPIHVSKQGFELLSGEFDEDHIRYTLAYYFQLHGWGWEPRLF